MEHSVHAATRAFVEMVAPTPIHLIKRVLAQRGEANDDTDSDTDPNPDFIEQDDDDDDVDFNPKDILGKILAFVNQVCSSPEAPNTFGSSASRRVSHHSNFSSGSELDGPLCTTSLHD